MKLKLTPRDTATANDMPLIDLCRPLSAHVMPKSALIASNGDVLSEKEARLIAKREASNRKFSRTTGRFV